MSDKVQPSYGEKSSKASKQVQSQRVVDKGKSILQELHRRDKKRQEEQTSTKRGIQG